MNPHQRNTSAEDKELLELQEALAALSVRVADLRRRRSTTAHQRPPSNQEHPTFTIGDRVSFHLNGYTVEGVIVDRTPHRFRIRHTGTGHIYLRSGNTINLIR